MNSPTFTGTPTVPGYAKTANASFTGTTNFTGTVNLPAGTVVPGTAPLDSPVFTGIVKIPAGATIAGYAKTTDLNSYATTASLQNYATTASLQNYATTAALSSYATLQNLQGYATAASLQNYATTAALGSYAPLNSPTFTGNPVVPGYALLANLYNYHSNSQPTLLTFSVTSNRSINRLCDLGGSFNFTPQQNVVAGDIVFSVSFGTPFSVPPFAVFVDLVSFVPTSGSIVVPALYATDITVNGYNVRVAFRSGTTSGNPLTGGATYSVILAVCYLP